jgi:hypothetical protein
VCVRTYSASISECFTTILRMATFVRSPEQSTLSGVLCALLSES